jgi:hypothetical protein
MTPRLAHLVRVPRPLLLVALLVLSLAAGVAAQEARLPVSTQDTVRTVLQRQMGKTVTLKLDSGDELTGKVRLVGDRIAHLEELAGKELFDAVVDLDEVAAVIVRAR